MHRAAVSPPSAQIRQGFSRRVAFTITQADTSTILPIASITNVRIGDVVMVENTEAQMYSATFGERSVDEIRNRFSSVLNLRCTELNDAVRAAMEDESTHQDDRSHIMREWQNLVAERDALLRPEADSGLPGAPTSAAAPPCYERAPATVFHPADSESGDPPPPRNTLRRGLSLHIVSQNVNQWTGEVSCQASWDSAAHDSAYLMKLTDPRFLVYVHLQIDCRLNNGCHRDLTLDKYVACRVHKRTHSFKERRGLFGFGGNTGGSAHTTHHTASGC